MNKAKDRQGYSEKDDALEHVSFDIEVGFSALERAERDDLAELANGEQPGNDGGPGHGKDDGYSEGPDFSIHLLPVYYFSRAKNTPK